MSDPRAVSDTDPMMPLPPGWYADVAGGYCRLRVERFGDYKGRAFWSADSCLSESTVLALVADKARELETRAEELWRWSAQYRREQIVDPNPTGNRPSTGTTHAVGVLPSARTP